MCPRRQRRVFKNVHMGPVDAEPFWCDSVHLAASPKVWNLRRSLWECLCESVRGFTFLQRTKKKKKKKSCIFFFFLELVIKYLQHKQDPICKTVKHTDECVCPRFHGADFILEPKPDPQPQGFILKLLLAAYKLNRKSDPSGSHKHTFPTRWRFLCRQV